MRLLFSLALLVGAGCALEAEAATGQDYRATIDALAGVYDFGVVEAPLRGCVVTLKRASTRRHAAMPVAINARCRRYPVLRNVSRWEPTGGGSVRLLGGKRLRELSDFSPVQDGSGVYMRGGFRGDVRVYQLRSRAR